MTERKEHKRRPCSAEHHYYNHVCTCEVEKLTAEVERIKLMYRCERHGGHDPENSCYPCHTEKLIKAESEVARLEKEKLEEYDRGWSLGHEPAKCGHARANWKDPKYGTPEYQGDERCEVCAEVERLREQQAEIYDAAHHYFMGEKSIENQKRFRDVLNRLTDDLEAQAAQEGR